jgi:tetratricopeptide (TPR) repeat protein
VLRFLDQPSDPRAAGRELGVDAVVDGSFQRAGPRVRVTVQLVDIADGSTMWASKMDASPDDLFRMQDEVARRIAEALHLELTPADERRFGRRQHETAAAGEAYALYLKGKVQLCRESLADCIAAVDWFEKSREADPGFALAWAGLADAYFRIAFEFQPEGDWHARAEAMCTQALALDPDLPEARYARARLLWSPAGGFEVAGALRELAAAVAGRPNLDDAFVRLGMQLYHVGLVAEAEAQLERALAISPDHLIARGHLASCRYHRAEFEQALALITPVAARSRSYWHQYVVAHCHLRLGSLDDARRVAERMPDLGDEGVGHGHAILGLAAALRGDPAEARRRAATALEHKKAFGHFHHDQYDVASIHAVLGDVEPSLDWLADAAHNGYPCHVFFERDPLLAALHPHPRFAALMEELREECAGYARLWAELQAASGAPPVVDPTAPGTEPDR